ncbi:MAG: hypothetical protein AAB687_01590 [Patescibacteria group bacterium]
MSDWKVVEKRHALGTDLLLGAMSGGAYAALGGKTYKYFIENTETGETKTVKASSEYELGDLISEGDFDED